MLKKYLLNKSLIESLYQVLLLALSLLVTEISFAQAHESRTIHHSGHAEEKFDIVIMADGIKRTDKKLFFDNAELTARFILNFHAMEKHGNKLNIHAIFTPSEEEGISLRAREPQPGEPIQKDAIKDTFFGVYYQNSYRAYFIDDKSIHKASKVASERFPFYDAIIILSHPGDKQGSGIASIPDKLAVVGLPSLMPPESANYLISHELIGHVIAGLGDAYSASATPSFNISETKDPQKLPWKHLLQHDDVGVVELVEGNDTNYSPNDDDFMKWGQVATTVSLDRIDNVFNSLAEDRLYPPHKVLADTVDRDKRSVKLSWPAIEKANSYEVFFIHSESSDNFSRKKIYRKTTDKNHVVFDKLPEAFFNSSDSLSSGSGGIRAYNSKTTSLFDRMRFDKYLFSSKEDIPVLPVPSQLKATDINCNSFRLEWDNNSDNWPYRSKDSALPYNAFQMVQISNKSGAKVIHRMSGDHLVLSGLKENEEYRAKIALRVYESDPVSSDFSKEITVMTQCNRALNGISRAKIETPSNQRLLSGVVQLRGWLHQSENSLDPGRNVASIQIDDTKPIPVEVDIYRPDVNQAMGIEASSRIGWSQLLYTGSLSNGRHSVRLLDSQNRVITQEYFDVFTPSDSATETRYIHRASETFSVDNFPVDGHKVLVRFNPSEQNFAIVDQLNQQGTSLKSNKLHYQSDQHQAAAATNIAGVRNVEVEYPSSEFPLSGVVSLRGWYYSVKQAENERRLYLTIDESDPIYVQRSSRSDVSTAMGIDKTEKLGWSTLFYSGSIPNGRHRIRLWAKGATGDELLFEKPFDSFTPLDKNSERRYLRDVSARLFINDFPKNGVRSEIKFDTAGQNFPIVSQSFK